MDCQSWSLCQKENVKHGMNALVGLLHSLPNNHTKSLLYFLGISIYLINKPIFHSSLLYSGISKIKSANSFYWFSRWIRQWKKFMLLSFTLWIFTLCKMSRVKQRNHSQQSAAWFRVERCITRLKKGSFYGSVLPKKLSYKCHISKIVTSKKIWAGLLFWSYNLLVQYM